MSQCSGAYVTYAKYRCVVECLTKGQYGATVCYTSSLLHAESATVWRQFSCLHRHRFSRGKSGICFDKNGGRTCHGSQKIEYSETDLRYKRKRVQRVLQKSFTAFNFFWRQPAGRFPERRTSCNVHLFNIRPCTETYVTWMDRWTRNKMGFPSFFDNIQFNYFNGQVLL